MSPIARFSVERSKLGWLLVLLLALLFGLGGSLELRDMRESERLALLQTDAERRAIEIMSQTLNGNLMGAVAVLGLINEDIKQEVLGKRNVNTPQMLSTLESVAQVYGADGVFLVTGSGIAGSSWDNSGKPSSGLNLKFRPYYRMAMQGMENIYAAVSLARGDRSLYFAAPVFRENTAWTTAIGAVVARTNLQRVDELLKRKGDIALLLSPQGVVFASSRPEWVGHLAGTPSPERLRDIRELKQFGKMFDDKPPSLLPATIDKGLMTFEGRRFAVATSPVHWNDPFGEWKLVMMEDLDRTVIMAERIWSGAAIGLAALLIGILILKILQSNYRQALAARQLEIYADEQKASAARKARLADAMVRMQRTKGLADLTSVFLDEAHDMLNALQGVVYVTDQQGQHLQLAGSYACANAPPENVAVGEGLLGQSAHERRSQIILTETGHFAMIRSGLGETAPAAVMIAPVMLNDVLLGVVEIALLRGLDDTDQAQFKELLALLAMNIEIVDRSARNEEALSTTLAAERAQAEQLTFQQALIDTIPYPVFYKGADARFLGVNAAYEKTFGVSRADLIGQRLIDLNYIEESKRTSAHAEDERIIAEMSSVTRESRVLQADGLYHDVVHSVSGLRGSDGNAAGLVGILIDITAMKHAEREMDRMADMERFNRLAQGREQRVLELKREINAMAEAAGQPAHYNTTLIETVADHEFTPHPDYRDDITDDGRPLQLGDLVDLDELQKLFSNFCEAVGVPAAIIDLQGNVLSSSPWQRACTDFHRVNPESCARCIESDTELSLKLQDGQDFTMYRCKNGMTDCASPIIVEGRHLANVFVGQFHLAPPDEDFFRAQARQFGYNEGNYLKAVHEAPVMDEKRLPVILGFLTNFARMISTMSLARRRADLAQQALQQQAELLHRERLAALSLAEDATQARVALKALSEESRT